MAGPLDLNLLRVLVALGDSRSVTRAATKLGMSQPGFSSALARLRDQLQDGMFVRTSDGMLPTPRAERLYALCAELLGRIEHEVEESARFDPSNFDGEFRLAMGDAGAPFILPPLMNHLDRTAPKARVHAAFPRVEEIARALESGDAELAIGYYPEIEGGGFRCQALTQQSFVCMMSADHPLAAGEITWENLAQYGYIGVGGLSRSLVVLEEYMKSRKVELPVRLHLPIFMSLPSVVARTRLIAIAPFSPGVHIPYSDDLKLLPMPADTPDFRVSQYWHARFNEQPRHQWLRATLFDLLHQPHPDLRQDLDPA